MDKKLESICERLAKWYPEQKAYAMDSIDKTLRESCAAYAKEHGTTVEELLKSLGYEMISGDAVYALRGPAKYAPGKEPEVIRGKIDSVLRRLDEAYPDKKIAGSVMNQHKNLAKDMSGVYQWLGYKSTAEFLAAYGYEYSDGAPGRRKSVDPEAIVKALQEKYPNGSPFKTADELFAGTEYESKLKTVKNNAKAVFGMSLTKYLQSIGLILGKTVSGEEPGKALEDNIEECDAFLAELKKRYPEGCPYLAVRSLMSENEDLQSKYNAVKNIWAKVYGEGITDTLKKEGILGGKKPDKSQQDKRQKKEIIDRKIQESVSANKKYTSIKEFGVDALGKEQYRSYDRFCILMSELYGEDAKSFLTRMGVINSAKKPILRKSKKTVNNKRAAELERRQKVLSRVSIEVLLSDVYYAGHGGIPSGLKVHCPDSYEVQVVADELAEAFRTAIDGVISKVEESLHGNNSLDGGFPIYHRVEGNDMIFTASGDFTEYGHDVRLHNELFGFGNLIENILQSDYPSLGYEGMVSCEQEWGTMYYSYQLLCNMDSNEYIKELILEDDDFWEFCFEQLSYDSLGLHDKKDGRQKCSSKQYQFNLAATKRGSRQENIEKIKPGDSVTFVIEENGNRINAFTDIGEIGEVGIDTLLRRMIIFNMAYHAEVSEVVPSSQLDNKRMSPVVGIKLTMSLSSKDKSILYDGYSYNGIRADLG